jgi:hypothetical protein
MIAPTSSRPGDLCAIRARWPRLVLLMQWVAILSWSEACAGLRDLAEHPRYGGGEAVAHFGGPHAVVQAAIRARRAMLKTLWSKHQARRTPART